MTTSSHPLDLHDYFGPERLEQFCRSQTRQHTESAHRATAASPREQPQLLDCWLEYHHPTQQNNYIEIVVFFNAKGCTHLVKQVSKLKLLKVSGCSRRSPCRLPHLVIKTAWILRLNSSWQRIVAKYKSRYPRLVYNSRYCSQLKKILFVKHNILATV